MFSTFEIYKDTYHGSLGEPEYNAVVGRAYAEIISQTNGLALNAPASMADNLSMCECALVDIVNSYSQTPAGVSGISNDGYSLSFGSGRGTLSELAHQECIRYLQVPVNLMCRWL